MRLFQTLPLAALVVLLGHPGGTPSTIPRMLGPLRLGMSLTALKALHAGLDVSCTDECAVGEAQASLTFGDLPGVLSALTVLGYDSSRVAATEGFDCTFYRGRLASLSLPSPSASADSAAKILTAQLGPWDAGTLGSAVALLHWRAPQTELVLVLAPPAGPGLPDLRHAQATRLELLDRPLAAALDRARARRRPVH